MTKKKAKPEIKISNETVAKLFLFALAAGIFNSNLQTKKNAKRGKKQTPSPAKISGRKLHADRQQVLDKPKTKK